MKSIEHKVYQKNLYELLKTDNTFVCCEYLHIDCVVLYLKLKRVIGYEIELTPRWVINNIKRDVLLGCNKVIILTESEKTLEQIKNKIRTDRIECYLIEDYLKKSKEQIYSENTSFDTTTLGINPNKISNNFPNKIRG